MYKQLNIILLILALVLGYLFVSSQLEEKIAKHPGISLGLTELGQLADSRCGGLEVRVSNVLYTPQGSKSDSVFKFWRSLFDSVEQGLGKVKKPSWSTLGFQLTDTSIGLDSHLLMLQPSLVSNSQELQALFKSCKVLQTTDGWQQYRFQLIRELAMQHFAMAANVPIGDTKTFNLITEVQREEGSTFLNVKPVYGGSFKGMKAVVRGDTILCDETFRYKVKLTEVGDFKEPVEFLYVSSKTGASGKFSTTINYQVK